MAEFSVAVARDNHLDTLRRRLGFGAWILPDGVETEREAVELALEALTAEVESDKVLVNVEVSNKWISHVSGLRTLVGWVIEADSFDEDIYEPGEWTELSRYDF